VHIIDIWCRAPTWSPFDFSLAFSACGPVWIVCRCLLNGSLAAMHQLQFYRVLCISLAAIAGAEQPCALYMFIVPTMDCRFGKSSESWAPEAIFLCFVLLLTRRTLFAFKKIYIYIHTVYLYYTYVERMCSFSIACPLCHRSEPDPEQPSQNKTRAHDYL
jgi:hypothetical protein